MSDDELREKVLEVFRGYGVSAEGDDDSILHGQLSDALLPLIHEAQAAAYDRGRERHLDRSWCVCWHKAHVAQFPEMHWRNPYRTGETK